MSFFDKSQTRKTTKRKRKRKRKKKTTAKKRMMTTETKATRSQLAFLYSVGER